MATDYVAHHLDRVASTQDVARDRYDGRPCLVTAAFQGAGRGRGGAGWLNATRALAASLAFEPSWPDDRIALVTLMAGLAARDALGPGLRLKWPNDVVEAAGDKVAGLLAERVDALVVVGMGVNLFWPEAPDGMGAVHAADPGPAEGARVAAMWADGLLVRIGTGPGAWDPAEYTAASATIGQIVEWDDGGPAVAVGIDPAGGLIVEGAGHRDILRSGRVRHVRPATLTD